MLGEFIEASINFSNADVWKIYGVLVVVFFSIAVVMFKASLNDD